MDKRNKTFKQLGSNRKRLFQTVMDEAHLRPIINPEVSHEHKRKALG